MAIIAILIALYLIGTSLNFIMTNSRTSKSDDIIWIIFWPIAIPIGIVVLGICLIGKFIEGLIKKGK